MALEAEHGLDADFDARGIVAGVVDRVVGARGRGELARGELVEALAFVP